MKETAKYLRWQEILLTFDKLDFLTTTQVQQLHNTGGNRNTLRILTDIQKEGFLRREKHQEYIWYLSKKGREEVDSEKRVKYVSSHIKHYLMRNQAYIHFKPKVWEVEKNIYSGRIIPDAIMKTDQYYVVEIDNRQLMKVNERKIKLYREFKESKQYKVFPILLFITTTEYRQKQLKAWLDGIKSEVLLYNDIR